MRFVLIAVAAFSLTACVNQSVKRYGPDPEITKEMVEEARRAYFLCLKSTAQDLDDGLSPADVIGTQIKGMCNTKGREWVRMEGRSTTTDPTYLSGFYQGGEKTLNSLPVQAVLRVRKDRREKQ